jgi:hypothetical protein
VQEAKDLLEKFIIGTVKPGTGGEHTGRDVNVTHFSPSPLQEAKGLLEKIIIGTVMPGAEPHQNIVASSPSIALLCVDFV